MQTPIRKGKRPYFKGRQRDSSAKEDPKPRGGKPEANLRRKGKNMERKGRLTMLEEKNVFTSEIRVKEEEGLLHVLEGKKTGRKKFES